MNATSTDAIVITGVGLACPYAASLADLCQVSTGAVPTPEMLPASWFDPTPVLGNRGFKYYTPATRYVLTASKLALTDGDLDSGQYAPEHMGVLLGTNFAVYRRLEAMDHIIRTEGAASLQPLEAPNFSVNIPASVVSLKCACRAFNISLTDAVVAGVQALILGYQAIRQQRARMVLAGATEETPPERIAPALGGPIGPGGACMFALETAAAAQARGARPYARIVGGVLRFVAPETLVSAATHEQLTEMLWQDICTLVPETAGALPYCTLSSSFAVNQSVHPMVQRVLEKRTGGVMLQRYVGADGALVSVSPLLQLAVLLAVHGRGVVLATSPHGHIAILVLDKEGNA